MGYQLIETVTVGSGGAASIEFTGIPQDGVDLQVVLSIRNSSLNSDRIDYYLNGVAPSPALVLRGSGSAVLSNTGSTIFWSEENSYTANTFASAALYIPNYTNSSVSKSISIDAVSENNATNAYQFLIAAVQNGTAAVTSLRFDGSSNHKEYSTASLYKITAD
jgi:hypothetical protein